ncbi:MAG: Hsp70 family protein [Myxococcota bacterium]|nr:Hsp70 family protein [Myxococcota bacterium]
MAEIAVGIDLGTSNSCVAHARGSRVEVLPNAYGENVTPSVVAFREDGSIVVGQGARSNLVHDPRNTVASGKRLIGRYFFSEEVKKAQAVVAYQIAEGPGHGVRVGVRGEQFSIPEISAMVLREMKSVAERKLGQEVTKAVVTVPAYFNDNQRQATKDAGRIAGLEVLRLLNEPTAAALAYGFGRGLTQRVAVYDLGGGTFDISVLEIGKDVFEVLSTCGDTYLGGDDFDDRLIDLLADEFQAAHGINLRKDPYALEKLKLAAELGKRGLSVDEQVEIRLPDVVQGDDGSSLSIERTVTAAEFSSLVMDLLQRTFKVCDEALQQAGLIARDLDGVILVGGPTRLPLVRQSVGDYFQQEPKTDVDPDEVVALGAAIHAASLVSDGDDDEEEDAASAFLLDVTPLSLRLGVAGGLAETVIERNTPVPIEQSRRFTTFQDDQERVQVRIYQGESRRAEENELLGQFEFSGFKKAPRGEAQIDVTFSIDSNGIVSVRACDPETGEETSTELSLSSGLSEDEIQNILDDGLADRVQSDAPDAEALVPAETSAAPAAVEPGPAVEPAPQPAPAVERVPEPAPAAAVEAAPELEIAPADEPLPELDSSPPVYEAFSPEIEGEIEEDDAELEIDSGISDAPTGDMVEAAAQKQEPATVGEEAVLDAADLEIEPGDLEELDVEAELEGDDGLFDRSGADLAQFGDDGEER